MKTSIVKTCMRYVEALNKYGSNRHIGARASITILPRAWSVNDRCSLRANAGHWEGKRFVSDTTAKINVFSYYQRALEVDPVQRTVEITAPYWWVGMQDVAYQLDLRTSYIHADRHDRFGWAARVENGTYALTPGLVLQESDDGLTCVSGHRPMVRSVISHESTAYIKAVRQRMRNDFTTIDRLRATGDKDHSPYSPDILEPYFEMSEHERVTVLDNWFGGSEFDNDAYRCMLAFGDVGQYNWRAWKRPTEYFQSCVRRASGAMRRAKFNVPL